MLIAQATASNTATIDWALPPGFARFRIISPNYLSATDGAALLVRVSTDGGSNYATSGYNTAMFGATTGSHGHADGGTGGMNVTYASGNATGEGSSILIDLLGAAAGEVMRMLASGCRRLADGSLATIAGMAQYTGTDRVTHIRLLCSSGNIASGTFYLYGEQ